MNNVTIVGRVETKEYNNDQLKLSISATRPFKNEKGIYETDVIPICVEGKLAKVTNDYVEKDNVIGIKGTLITIDNKLYVKAQNISYLSRNN